MPDSAERKILDPDHGRWSKRVAANEDSAFPDIDDLIAGNLVLESLEIWRERARRGTLEQRPAFISDVGNMRALHFSWHSAQSEMDLLDPIALRADYTRVMMGFLLFNPRPARIEMIGLGGGSLPKFCHHVLPDTDITVVEISPKIIGLRDEFSIPPDDHRFRVICADGADFVLGEGTAPDILLIDGFDEFGQPPQLCSPEFYDHCYERLAPGGLMVVNLWGGGKLNRRYTERIRQSFAGNISSIPTERGFNRAVIGRKGVKLALSRAELAVAGSFGKGHAAFLPSVGKRICRQLDRGM